MGKSQLVDWHQGQHEADISSIDGPLEIGVTPTIDQLDALGDWRENVPKQSLQNVHHSEHEKNPPPGIKGKLAGHANE